MKATCTRCGALIPSKRSRNTCPSCGARLDYVPVAPVSEATK